MNQPELQAQPAAHVAIATTDELPPVLASPPWLRPRTGKPAKALALEPLPLPPREGWPRGSRAALLKSERKSRLQVGSKTLAQFLGFASEEQANATTAIDQGDVKALLDAWERSTDLKTLAAHSRISISGTDIDRLPDALGIALWNRVAARPGVVDTFDLWGTELVLARHGSAILPGLVTLLKSRSHLAMPCVGLIGAVELALPIARTLVTLKTHRDAARRWLLAWPEHAACGLLAPALGKRGAERNYATTALRLLANQGHEELLIEVAERYSDARIVAALRALLAEDPLEQHPARIAELPPFWQPQMWSPLLLRGSGKALPLTALDAFGQMLRFPLIDGVYPGLLQVQEACTPQSLTDFLWDCFTAWRRAKAPLRENWIFIVLGHLGNDDIARRLGKLQPCLSLKEFHIWLDVLVEIDSDVALRQLDSAAEETRRALSQQKLREVAKNRGLGEQELRDRLVPTFDLDIRACLPLNLGARQITLGLDETFTPYLNDGKGARLRNLPKARAGDDPVLRRAASECLKQLKKEVPTIVAALATRLELDMCDSRRWLPEDFRLRLLGHPLLRRLVQQLVWGVYALDDTKGGGGRLLQSVRIAEDGSTCDAADRPLVLPEGATIRYGLVHALELPAPEAAAFEHLFVDYRLLQPFQQLGRENHSLVASERDEDVLLKRWEGGRLDRQRQHELAQRGWRLDGTDTHVKPLNHHYAIAMSLNPGLRHQPQAEQTIEEIELLWLQDWPAGANRKTLDPITASELIREMEYLCA